MSLATDIAAPARSDGRGLGSIGLVGAGVAIGAVAALHVLSIGRVDPVRRTISEYAVGDFGWLFDTGVLALAVGCAALLLALLRSGHARLTSPATVLYALGVLGLVLVVVFEKTNWAIGPSLSGTIHRYSSLLVFVALPLGVALLGRAVRSRWAVVLGALTLLTMLAILAGIPLGPVLGRPWWQVWPLGLMERVVAVALVAGVVALGVRTVRGAPATITA